VKDSSYGLLIIAGGDWHEGMEKEPIKDDSRELKLAMAIATAAHMPVTFLSHVPFQPLFDGRREDQIIAYTFDKFLQTGDEEWPLLLPMTKAAVRAMDTIQAFAKSEWQLDVPKFVVTGASKRGWTTWLTGASDPRVVAIAPMVIDLLHMDKQMQHQREAYGAYSERIKEYTELNIQDRMDSERGKKLLSIVDPYSYRKRLTMPKLLILGTNDPYWTVDALNIYYDDLEGEKHILYVPNAGHGLNNDLGRLTSDVAAFCLRATGKLEFPKLKWEYEQAPDGLRLSIRSDKKPATVTAWLARSSTRDFREAKWKPQLLDSNDDRYLIMLKQPPSGYAAAFGEVLYQIDGHPLYLSTTIRVIGAQPAAK
jgi:PhoPQ-activated pathogenicity-related protein